MSTVSALLTLVDAMYPNSATDATVVSYFNMAQNELSKYFGLITEDYTLYTVANNDTFALPSGIEDVSQIDTLDVYNEIAYPDLIVSDNTMKLTPYTIAENLPYASKLSVTHRAVGNTDTLGTIEIDGTVNGVVTTESITPIANNTVFGNTLFDIASITQIVSVNWVTAGTADKIDVGLAYDKYNFTRYSPGYVDDPKQYGNVYYQVYDSSGVKWLVIHPTPITSGYNIRIRYHKFLTALSESSTSVSPDFDSRFHDMLALYAAWMICSTGASADERQADRFLRQYDERLTDLWKYSMEKDKKSMLKRRDNQHWH